MENGITFWFTGRPCAGKTVIAKEIMKTSKEKFVHLDGDDLRKNLCSDLGFSYEDRKENLRRVAEVSKLFNSKLNGSNVLATFVSPTNGLREYVKEIIGYENFKLIYVKAPLSVCESRDVKGMYNLARSGKIKEFTGIDSPFEEPLNPDLVLDTSKYTLDKCLNLFNKFYSSFYCK